MTTSVTQGWEMMGNEGWGLVVFNRKLHVVLGLFRFFTIPYRIFWRTITSEDEYNFVCKSFDNLDLKTLLAYYKRTEKVLI